MDKDKKNNIKKGNIGERMALDFLLSGGYDICKVNWRSKKAEIDLIVKDGRVLVFVEVKLRTSVFYGDPALSVNHKKRKLLIAAATSYMDIIKYDGEIRFDIITIVYKTSEDFVIEHYKDAFFPGI